MVNAASRSIRELRAGRGDRETRGKGDTEIRGRGDVENNDYENETPNQT